MESCILNVLTLFDSGGIGFLLLKKDDSAYEYRLFSYTWRNVLFLFNFPVILGHSINVTGALG